MACRCRISPRRLGSLPTMPGCACSGRGRRCGSAWSAGADRAPTAAASTVPAESRAATDASTARDDAREARGGAPCAGCGTGLLRRGAGAAVAAAAAGLAGAAGATATGLGGGAATALLLAAAVSQGRHRVSPRWLQQAVLPAVVDWRRRSARALHPARRDSRERRRGPGPVRWLRPGARGHP